MNHLIGIGLIIISAASFGTMAIFADFVYGSGITVPSLLFFRFAIAALIMIPVVLWRRQPFPKGRDLGVLIAMGAVGYAGQSYTFFTSLTLIPASLTAILLYIYPVLVAMLSVYFLDEALTRKKLTALALALAGVVLVIGPERSGNPVGILYGVGAAVIYSVYNIAGAQVMKRNDTLNSSLVIILSAAGTYLAMNLKSGFFIPEGGATWVCIAAIGLICTFVAIYTYFLGMNRIGAVSASMLSTFEPVTTVILAALLLDQQLGWIQAGGGALILLSALIVASGSGRPIASSASAIEESG
ncbi:MAG TPA: EamA family transporter [Desulfobacteraceae bacterium]|nr:EamA family transporter [Desulfobacteraceae bacterium]